MVTGSGPEWRVNQPFLQSVQSHCIDPARLSVCYRVPSEPLIVHSQRRHAAVASAYTVGKSLLPVNIVPNETSGATTSSSPTSSTWSPDRPFFTSTQSQTQAPTQQLSGPGPSRLSETLSIPSRNQEVCGAGLATTYSSVRSRGKYPCEFDHNHGRFVSKRDRARHYGSIHGVYPFQYVCGGCNRHDHRRDAHLRHLVACSTEGSSYCCGKCAAKFSDKKGYYEHFELCKDARGRRKNTPRKEDEERRIAVKHF